MRALLAADNLPGLRGTPISQLAQLCEWAPLASVVAGPVAGVVAAILAARSQQAKFRSEIDFQRERLRTEFATEYSAEVALKQFLEVSGVTYRSFPMIRHHLGGFQPNDLRRLLVRAGAVRFMAADGTELWALREKVGDAFQLSRWKHPDVPRNKVPESELFPAAFNDPSQC